MSYRTTARSLWAALNGLGLCVAPRLNVLLPASSRSSISSAPKVYLPSSSRTFSTTRVSQGSWLEPNIDRTKKKMKGRCRVPTGGSLKGTTVRHGDYGLRMRDHDRRISAAHLRLAEDTIRARLRGLKYRLFKRVNCDIGVYTKGNDMRMGKGKGSFDYWSARVAVSRIVFELRGAVHEKIVRDAFRLAGNKLPGQWDFVKRGEPPVMGITSLKGTSAEELKRPRKKVITNQSKATVLPSSTPQTSTPVPPANI